MTFEIIETIRRTFRVDCGSPADAISQCKSGNVAAKSEGRPTYVVRTIPEWPVILNVLKSQAQPGDRGAGDIIARLVGPIGGDKFKAWYLHLFGKDCGCGDRQEALNQRWPL